MIIFQRSKKNKKYKKKLNGQTSKITQSALKFYAVGHPKYNTTKRRTKNIEVENTNKNATTRPNVRIKMNSVCISINRRTKNKMKKS